MRGRVLLLYARAGAPGVCFYDFDGGTPADVRRGAEVKIWPPIGSAWLEYHLFRTGVYKK